jgi:hypothetical protein
MAMLAIAYSRADESISERPSPSEVGGYVFDARQTFHKIAAAAGGYYVLIDTAADSHYNATGLQRVHRAGVPYPALSDSAAGEREYEPGDAPKAAIAPGIEWKDAGPQADWIGLADFSGTKGPRTVRSADLKVQSAEPGRVAFDVVYSLATDGHDDRVATERYVLTAAAVQQTSTVSGDASGYRVHLPVLVSDGAADTVMKLTSNGVSSAHLGSTTAAELPADDVLDAVKLEGPRVVTHNGYVREAAAGVRSNSITITIILQQK